MLNLAEKKSPVSAWMGAGLVIEEEREGFRIETEFGIIVAERAEGCLVVPEKGDKVLLYWDGSGEAYILSVLKRQATDAPTVISAKGDAKIQSPGDMQIAARTINMLGMEKTSLKSQELNIQCVNVKTGFKELSCRGYRMVANIDVIKTVAERMETAARRVMERINRRYVRVEEFEDMRIGRLQMWVKDLFSVKSKNASLKSKDRIKLDADSIHLG